MRSLPLSPPLPPQHRHRWAALAGLVLLVVALAAFVRLHDLGGAPLADDEYYTARSIEWILAGGLPAIPDGGYYLRSLLFQYSAAGSAWLFGADAFAYRLPSVVFGLLAGLLGFLYARRFAGRVGAAGVAAALLLSSWEIEFSRLVRFYTLFQCATLLFLIALDKAYFEARRSWRYAPHAALVPAALAHELTLLLVPLLFLPLVPWLTRLRFPDRVAWVRFALVSLLSAAALVVLILTLGELRHEVAAPLPEDYAAPPGRFDGPFATPALPFFRLAADPLVHMAAVGALAAGLVLGFIAWSRRPGSRLAPPDLLLALALLAGLFHLLAVVVLVLAFAFARYGLRSVAAHPPRRAVLLSCTLAAVASWLLLAAWAPEYLVNEQVGARWGISGDSVTAGVILRGAWSTFFGWPDFYRPTLRPFATELPELGLALVAAFLWVGVTQLRNPSWPDLVRHPGAVLLYWALITAFFTTGSTTSRYWFHLLPVIYTFLALTLIDLTQRLRPALTAGAGSLAFLVLFALGPDFQPRHILDVGADAVRYRTDAFARFAETWYPRQDVRTPAETVAHWRSEAPGARIVVDRLPALSYYLDVEHAVYLDREGARFARVSRERGTREMWSGQRLLSTPGELLAFMRPAEELWLVRSTDPAARDLDLEALPQESFVVTGREVPGRDGRIEVVRLRPQPESQPPP